MTRNAKRLCMAIENVLNRGFSPLDYLSRECIALDQPALTTPTHRVFTVACSVTFDSLP